MKSQRTFKSYFTNTGRVGSSSRVILPLRWQRVLRLTQISKADIEGILKVGFPIFHLHVLGYVVKCRDSLFI